MGFTNRVAPRVGLIVNSDDSSAACDGEGGGGGDKDRDRSCNTHRPIVNDDDDGVVSAGSEATPDGK